MPNMTPKEKNAGYENMPVTEQEQHKIDAINVAETIRTMPASDSHNQRLNKRIDMYSSSRSFDKNGASAANKRPSSREHNLKEDYLEHAPELLYCDPKRLEYYDDGSLRIFDEDIIKAIYIWAAEHGMERGWKGGDVIVNARGC